MVGRPYSCGSDPVRIAIREKPAGAGGTDMTPTQVEPGGTTRLIETVERAENVSLEAVRKFIDTVNGAFPDGEDGPRRRIIDSAFEMTEKLVNNWTGVAKNILAVTEKELKEPGRKSASSK